MFRRVSSVAVGVTSLCVLTLASPAGAGAPNRTSITMTCDRDTTSAIAVVVTYDRMDGTQIGAPTTVRCGTDAGLEKRERVVVEDLAPVGATSIGGFDVTSDQQVVTCEGAGTLTFELDCTGPTGAGAKVTVR